MQQIEIPVETRPITEEEEVALGFPSRRGMLDLDVYTIRDVAERLGLTEVTIRTHIKKKKLKAIQFKGAAGSRILRHHIYEWLISMQTDLRDDISDGTE
jgi:excisionase family DNA binding protein